MLNNVLWSTVPCILIGELAAPFITRSASNIFHGAYLTEPLTLISLPAGVVISMVGVYNIPGPDFSELTAAFTAALKEPPQLRRPVKLLEKRSLTMVPEKMYRPICYILCKVTMVSLE